MYQIKAKNNNNNKTLSKIIHDTKMSTDYNWYLR